MADLEEAPDGTNNRAAGSLRETVAPWVVALVASGAFVLFVLVTNGGSRLDRPRAEIGGSLPWASTASTPVDRILIRAGAAPEKEQAVLDSGT